ncbi:MAG: PepSY-associated TM helix domain-containing protein, partial [Noviherbaspirillum sp.]
KWNDVGQWLLATVSIAMLTLLISGVIIHKKIFADFFTFRPGKSKQRATLDLHNVSSVLLLPFHFLITLSGLIIFMFIYMKPGIVLVYGTDAPRLTREAFGQVTRAPAKQPGQLVHVDPMVTQAQTIWGGGGVRNVSIRNPQDKHALVEVLRRPHDEISYETHTVTFDGVTGELLGKREPVAAARVQRFFTGLHMIPFSHWGLRWMYFAMGLVSCVMIATGLLLWVEKRRVRQEKEGRSSYRVVNAVAVASTLGVLVATLAMLIANKLLPALPNRAAVEQWIFFAAWIACLLHPLARAFGQQYRNDIRIAWREQAWISAALAVLAATLNAVLTGDHLLLTLAQRDFAVAGTDLVLLLTAALALVTARRLGARETAASAAPAVQGVAV